MKFVFFAPVLVGLLAGCGGSGSSSVDSASAILGSWLCDDEITLVISGDGRYEWQVPAGSGIGFGSDSNEHVRVEADGAYALLGAWRLQSTKLELDMLGETDAYSIAFDSSDRFTIKGPETYTCARK